MNSGEQCFESGNAAARDKPRVHYILSLGGLWPAPYAILKSNVILPVGIPLLPRPQASPRAHTCRMCARVALGRQYMML